MNHLLIWEFVPEKTVTFILDPAKDAKLIELAAASHGYCINAEDNDYIHELDAALAGRETGYESDNGAKDPISGGPFAAVYICASLC